MNDSPRIPEQRFVQPRLRAVLILVICVAFLVLGLGMMLEWLGPVDTLRRIVGAVVALLSGLGIVAGILSLFRPQSVTVNDHGVAINSLFAQSFMPWENIEGIGIIHAPTTMIAFRLRDVGSGRNVTESMMAVNETLVASHQHIPKATFGNQLEPIKAALADAARVKGVQTSLA